MDDKPPSRISNLVNSYYPVVCYPIAPINAYRVLFWFRTHKKRGVRIVRSNSPHYVRHVDILAYDGVT